MKNILLISTACLALSACESMSDMTWASMNPFSATETQETVEAPTATINSSAVATELNEMEKLTGYAPQFTNKAEPETIDTLFEEAIEADITTPVQDVKIENPIEPIETSKPNEPIIEPTVKPEQAIKEVIEETKSEIIATQESPVEMPPITPVEVKQPQVIEPVQASDMPMFTDKDLSLSSDQGCPQIKIMPSARSMTYFENELSGDLLARAVINEIRGGCEITSKGMELDLDIIMDGRITNKGRFEGNKDQEAFMTFPYFVSVLTPQGLPVDKKIMATAMRFRPSVDYLDHAEKITQYIPMDDTSNASNYKIVVGFQLTRKQLEYNRAQNMMRADNKRVAPDLVNQPRRSINPLAQ